VRVNIYQEQFPEHLWHFPDQSWNLQVGTAKFETSKLEPQSLPDHYQSWNLKVRWVFASISSLSLVPSQFVDPVTLIYSKSVCKCLKEK
jgi:hypothetical protein